MSCKENFISPERSSLFVNSQAISKTLKSIKLDSFYSFSCLLVFFWYNRRMWYMTFDIYDFVGSDDENMFRSWMTCESYPPENTDSGQDTTSSSGWWTFNYHVMHSSWRSKIFLWASVCHAWTLFCIFLGELALSSLFK